MVDESTAGYRRDEHGTASLSERLLAARRCQDAGYRLGFHFDPIVEYPNWEDDYEDARPNFCQRRLAQNRLVEHGGLARYAELEAECASAFRGHSF